MLETILIYLGLSVLIEIAARRQGRHAGMFFFISILLTPLVAALILLLTHPKE